jgi:hypothetical protein
MCLIRSQGSRRLRFYSAGFVFLLLFLASCKLTPDEPEEETFNEEMYDGLARLNFQAVRMTDYRDYKVEAVLLAENDACSVYGDAKAKVLPSTAGEVAREYKEHIAPSITGAFGNYYPSGEKIVILLLDIVDGYKNKGDTYVAGYFDFNDMFPKNFISTSNDRLMLYVDVNPGKPGDNTFYSTIAHELQHLINFSSRFYRKGISFEDIKTYSDLNKLIESIQQDDWVDEGLSSAAEYIYNRALGKNIAGKWHITDKISYYNNAETYYKQKQSNIVNGNNFFTWGEGNGTYVYDDYVTVYLFFQWLRIQAGDDMKIYRSIVESDYTGFRAVTDAARLYIPRLFEGAEFTDEQAWERLLETWLAANYFNAPKKDAADGLFGYNDEFKLYPPIISDKRASLNLYPGEGVYSVMNGKPFKYPELYPESPAHIRYAGLSKAGNSLTRITQGKSGTGDALLTFNANSNTTFSRETGFLASPEIVPSEQPAPGRTADLPSAPRPIDARPPIRF